MYFIYINTYLFYLLLANSLFLKDFLINVTCQSGNIGLRNPRCARLSLFPGFKSGGWENYVSVKA